MLWVWLHLWLHYAVGVATSYSMLWVWLHLCCGCGCIYAVGVVASMLWVWLHLCCGCGYIYAVGVVTSMLWVWLHLCCGCGYIYAVGVVTSMLWVWLHLCCGCGYIYAVGVVTSMLWVWSHLCCGCGLFMIHSSTLTIALSPIFGDVVACSTVLTHIPRLHLSTVAAHRVTRTHTELPTSSLINLARLPTEEGRAFTRPLVIAVLVKACCF